MSDVGIYGIGQTGVFQRTLPPRSRMNYDPTYELGIEVARWFHYRYGFTVSGYDRIDGRAKLESVMTSIYQRIFSQRGHKKHFETLRLIAVVPKIQEFVELFKDVLAELELTGNH